MRELEGFAIHATDGDIGHVDQGYFDDAHWTVRYLVVDTGHWLPGRKVLIAPAAIREADWKGRQLQVNLTRRQVENSPDIDTEKPVSRQQETEYAGYYGWPYWWVGPGPAGPLLYPGVAPPAPEIVEAVETTEAAAAAGLEDAWPVVSGGDPHLRSTREVIGYHLQARDGAIGHVGDFILDDASWIIRYLVVDTGSWWPGKKVLLPPQWIEGVSWAESEVRVDLDRETIRRAPEWEPGTSITRDYEERLYGYYGRPGYWSPAAPKG
jgi:hypothetical protein